MKAYLKVRCPNGCGWHSCWTDAFFYYYECPKAPSGYSIVTEGDVVEEEE